MSFLNERMSPFELTRKRPLDLNEYHSTYNSPSFSKHPRFVENYPRSSYNTSLCQGFQAQTWDHPPICAPPFAPIIDRSHESPREYEAIPPKFQNPSRDLSRGYDEMSSKFHDQRRNDGSYDGFRKGEAKFHKFKPKRNRNWKKKPFWRDQTRDFSKSDFGSSQVQERSSKVRNASPIPKIIPTGHNSVKYDTISPRSQVREGENPKGTVGKMKQQNDLSRKGDIIRTKDKPKEGSMGKVNTVLYSFKRSDPISPQNEVKTSEKGSIVKVNSKRDSVSPRFQAKASEKPIEASIQKVNPQSHLATKCKNTSLLPNSLVETSDDLKDIPPVKINPSLGYKRKCDAELKAIEKSIVKMVNPRLVKIAVQDNTSESPNEAKASKDLVIGVAKLLRGNIKTQKVNAICEFPKSCVASKGTTGDNLVSRKKEPLKVSEVSPLKVSEVSPSDVLKLDYTTSEVGNDNIECIDRGLKVDEVEKVVKELKADVKRKGTGSGFNVDNLVGEVSADDKIGSVEPGLIESEKDTMLRGINEKINGVKVDEVKMVASELKADDVVEEVSKEAPLPNNTGNGTILLNAMDKVCTNPKRLAHVVSGRKYPPRRKGFSAVRDFPVKFRIKKDQACIVKNDVAPSGKKSRSSSKLEPKLEERSSEKKLCEAQRKYTQLFADKPLECVKKEDVAPIFKDDLVLLGNKIQSGSALEPKLEEKSPEEKLCEAQTKCTQPCADKPFECENKEDKNEKENSSISPFVIESLPFKDPQEKKCTEVDVEMFDAADVTNPELVPNQDKMEAIGQIGPTEKSVADGEEKCKSFNDISTVPFGDDDVNTINFEDFKTVSIRKQVIEVLDSYRELLEKLLEDNRLAKESGKGKGSKQVPMDAAAHLQKQKRWVNSKQMLGHVPGVEVGDRYRFRAELVCIGLHLNFYNGIEYIIEYGRKLAVSVVHSGRYENDEKLPDVLQFCGQGENPDTGRNVALYNSIEAKTPVRVIRKTNNSVFQYYYDGLYLVAKVTQVRNKNGSLVCKFQLNRMVSSEATSSPTENVHFLVEDLAQGKEKIPINVVNTVDDEKLPFFNYIAHMRYPDSCYLEMCGCDCKDGCSDIRKCQCFIKNRGEVFDDDGSIIIGPKAKRFIYECGSSCKCPPSCKNRVSQYGIRYQLEIFKTKSMGWGVRSRNYIPAGSFICEYVGELLQEQEAEERSNNDEYLFDIDKDAYTIDAAKCGNIGRFINHSCSPNIYAQYVLFDHDNKRMPHVMFFTVNGIFPYQELTYDYNYKVDSVYDEDGNIKKKECHCGARCCTGRLY